MNLAETPKLFDRDILSSDSTANSAQEMLLKLGLTQNESKVYLYLNRHGSKKAVEIAQNQNLPRTQTYHLLSSLQSKGLVTVISDRPTKFEGIEFEQVLDILIDYEQKRIEKLQLMRGELTELWKENFYK